MPSINRIRVNNVKYNFGTQYYDDFTMGMYGKNTLYDLANGGGKSVLMLLLMQNMIPNSTLDDKQPIEKLFRTGNNNTTIHSLVEWKLDEPYEDGYRYMTTGFCARKSKDEDSSEETSKDVASIEYFNYCIFYREYNKNDIINLPLAKDNERVTYQGLKSYLKELPHRDMSLKVMVFDRKGEYQRYISGYGIHESQWEIIRGINKTEGHVRTYFENNYKTTRKVVEDLLIEEIIEKAYAVKTNLEDDRASSMAKMLMDIKEQLTELSKKKRDIAAYGHQIELIALLKDKVASFIDYYQEQSKLAKSIADIYVTGEDFVKRNEEKLNELIAGKENAEHQRNTQQKRIECLKVARDKRSLSSLDEEQKDLEKKISDTNVRLKELLEDKNYKEATNEYLDYMEERKKYNMQDAVIKNMLAESSFDEELLYTYVYNIKLRLDVVMNEIAGNIAAIDEAIIAKDAKYNYQQKLLSETITALAVAENAYKNCETEITDLSKRLSDVRMTIQNIKFVATDEWLAEKEAALDKAKADIEDVQKNLETDKNLLAEKKASVSILKSNKSDVEKRVALLSAREDEYKNATSKLDGIKEVYGAKNPEELLSIIGKRIVDKILELETTRRKIDNLDKRIERLAEGRIININEAAAKVIDYIESRHGIPAMYGMDYLSALSIEQQKEILDKNPELPYGVIVKDFEVISDDPNIAAVNTDDSTVHIYDMDMVSEKALHYGDNTILVAASPEYMTDPNTVTKLIQAENDRRTQYKERVLLNEEILATYKQDQEFVVKIKDSELLSLSEELAKAKDDAISINAKIDEDEAYIRELNSKITSLNAELDDKNTYYEGLLSDANKLLSISQLEEIIKEREKEQTLCAENVARLKTALDDNKQAFDDCDKDNKELLAKKRALELKMTTLNAEWENNYKSYYNVDKEYDNLTISDEELKARFMAFTIMGNEDAKAIEDKKVVMDTLKSSMDRILRNIENRGVKVDTLRAGEENNSLYYSDEEVLLACNKAIEDTKLTVNTYEKHKRMKETEANKLLGSIEYAILNIEGKYGSYEDIDADLSEIVASLTSGNELLSKLEQEAIRCEKEYKNYMKQQSYMLDLYKDAKRIITTNDISTKDAKVLSYDRESLRETFEDSLLAFDKNAKKLERAKNELVKFKGNTAAALDEMEVYELAKTIRDDVIIPSDYVEATTLVDNLKAITSFIELEKERVLKSLEDMETIKENFCEQCLQRCLDVKTELDKLPKLSKIISDGEAIQMVGLSIPYIKEDFRKQRMSDYIDRVVSDADGCKNDKERIKFIRNSLALKKLFSVIVADMNAIKLSLYKRERIKEQSRYLRYEEAVGSTGQSQGIYIQFLVSIINYISGMYRMGDEDTRSKTIFIDNPFGAAKDVYIWEPIFALLKANNVQLVVPARGATPAITGRFDVNYILGQQLTGGKQLTVVVDYTSKIDQEEVWYKDLEYEQVSFDFI